MYERAPKRNASEAALIYKRLIYLRLLGAERNELGFFLKQSPLSQVEREEIETRKQILDYFIRILPTYTSQAHNSSHQLHFYRKWMSDELSGHVVGLCQRLEEILRAQFDTFTSDFLVAMQSAIEQYVVVRMTKAYKQAKDVVEIYARLQTINKVSLEETDLDSVIAVLKPDILSDKVSNEILDRKADLDTFIKELADERLG